MYGGDFTTNSSFTNIVPDGGELASRYLADTGIRLGPLQTAWLCAAYTWAFILPQPGQSSMVRLPESHQSIGARGIVNQVGKALSALYPADAPFAQLVPAPRIMFDPSVADDVKTKMEQALYADTLTLMALMEGAFLDDSENQNKRPVSFRGRMGQSIAQLFITGDTLERMTPDFRVQVYRRDQYVTRRDSCGDVLYHGVLELIDPMAALTEEQRATCKLSKDKSLKEKSSAERMRTMVTFCDWHPWTKKWVTKQECNGVIFNKSDDPVSPFCSVPMHLVGGEHYGRGLVETSWLPDLRSYNTILLRLLEWAALASKKNPCIDPSSEVSDEDINTEPGMPIRTARVTGGVVQDIAWTGIDNLADFKVVESVAARLYQDLSKSMLLESEITPQKERTTAFQVQRIAAELDGISGGNWGSITEESQVPKIRYYAHHARLKGLLPKLKDKHVKIDILSGLPAIARANKLGNILQTVDVFSRLGPDGMKRIDLGKLGDVTMRLQNLYVPGLIKTDETVAQETKAAMAQQAQMQGAEKGIDAAGNVAEASLTQQLTGQG